MNENDINNNEIINIRGVTDSTIKTFGTIYLKLFLNTVVLCHKFHVVPDEFNISSDGILGKDFMKTFNCILSYKSMKLTIYPFQDERYIQIKIKEGPDEESIIIPPRSEVIRKFQINSDQDCVVLNQEIGNGVFLPLTIVNPQNAYIRVLNVNDFPQKVLKNILNISHLSDFNVYKVDEIKNLDHRKKKIEDMVSNKLNNLETKNDIINLCKEFSEIFTLEDDTMTKIDFYTQKLRIADNKPVYVKNYRLPYTQKLEVEKQVTKLLKNDLIEPSQSSYNSPIVLVPKKSYNGEKKYRMCIDYRNINKKLIADKYPLPRIDEILDGLGRAKYFSVLDLYNGFHQVPLHEDSRDVTSFSSEKGSFRWKVLPFGLNVSPNSFSRMMSLAFSGIGPDKLFLYMDDIIVIGCSESHHLKNLKLVFDVCRKMNLKLNPQKCEFAKTSVTFLGHKCTDKGILPDDSKTEVVKNYPIPFDKDSTRRFVAFANYYRRFISNFAEKSAPLNKLTRKNVKFEWTEECKNSFQYIINKILKPPILAYPDFSQKFIITVDASKLGCGAILSQNHTGDDLPICFASKAFTKGEQNKATIEQELIAMHWAIKYFRPYIYGMKFLVRSDHRPLTYLFALKDPNSRLTRIRLDLSEFDFVVEHIKGKLNVGADALSRIYIKDLINIQQSDNNTILVTTRSMTKRLVTTQVNEINESQNDLKIKVQEADNGKIYKKTPKLITSYNLERNEITFKVYTYNHKVIINYNMKFVNDKNFLENCLSRLDLETRKINVENIRLQKDDNLFKIIACYEFIKRGNEILKYVNIIIIKPPIIVKLSEEKKRIIEMYHDNPIFGGHSGQKRLYSKIRANYKWKNMSRDVAEHVKNCEKCKLNKSKTKILEPMKITDTPWRAFDSVSVDTIGPFRKTDNDNVYAVTIICNLSKFLITVAIPNKEAKTVARAIFEHLILKFGLVNSILTDMGTEYLNSTINELVKMLKIDHKNSTPYHHQTLGIVERNHRVLNEYLRSYIRDDLSDWDEYLKYFTYCYNITPNTSFDCNFSPFELVFGKVPKTVDEFLQNRVDPIYNVEDYVKQVKYRLQSASKIAHNFLIASKEHNKKYYDKNKNLSNFKINDKVFLKEVNKNKLESVYTGPYIIKNINDLNVTIVSENNKSKIVHKNNIIKC